MTMPHLMNCPHSDVGWCLGCVKELWEKHNGEIDKSNRASDKVWDMLEENSTRGEVIDLFSDAIFSVVDDTGCGNGQAIDALESALNAFCWESADRMKALEEWINDDIDEEEEDEEEDF